MSRQRLHIEKECRPYLEQVSTKRARSDTVGNRSMFQPTIAVSKWTTEDSQKLDELCALYIYRQNLPFTHFEDEDLRAIFRRLQPKYEPPRSHRLRHGLLDEVYTKTKKEVDEIIDKEDALGITFDETTNVRNQRVTNVAVITGSGAFYYHNLILPPVSVTAAFLTDLIVESIDKITKGHRERMNSVTTDTCSVMGSLWTLLPQKKGLERVMMNPCDAHGIQLLISDILKFPPFEQTVKMANQLVGHFKHSPKQMAILSDIQQNTQSDQKMLVIANTTRWGTHLAEFISIVVNKSALRAFLSDPRVDLRSSDTAKSVANTLRNPVFFSILEELIILLTPLQKAQKASERDDAHVGRVRNRWDRVLEEIKRKGQELSTDITGLYPIFEKRRDRQINDVHNLAFWLMPDTVYNHTKFDKKKDEQERVEKKLMELIEPHEFDDALLTFHHYYNRFDAFRDTHHRWKYHNDPLGFWSVSMAENRALAVLAIRMVKTLANSCPSERAFSTLKATHTNTRNRLQPDRVNKLLFIQINSRVLKRDLTTKRAVVSAEDEEDADVEEALAEPVLELQSADLEMAPMDLLTGLGAA